MAHAFPQSQQFRPAVIARSSGEIAGGDFYRSDEAIHPPTCPDGWIASLSDEVRVGLAMTAGVRIEP